MVGFLNYVESQGFFRKTEILENTNIVLDAGIFFVVHKARMNNLKLDSYDGDTSVYTGGSYLWLADTINRVIHNLRQHNVQPIVVAANIEPIYNIPDDRRELEAHMESVRDFEHNCPYVLQFPLRHIVVGAVLRELGVEVLVADDVGREVTMVTIANELGCPVLSMYPPSLLHPVHGGVKFMGGRDYWKYEFRLYSSDGGVPFKDWNYQDFIRRAAITADDFALMAAADELCETGMENEEIPPREFYTRLIWSVKEISTKEDKIDELVRRWHGSRTEGAKLQFEKSLEKHRSISKAGPDSATVITHLRSNDFKHVTRNGKILPPVYQKLLRRSLFASSFWSILATRRINLHVSEEDPKMKSAKLCSRRIRQFSYAILLNFDGPPSGKEYFQNNGEYENFSSESRDQTTEVSLEKVPDLLEDQRQAILFNALDVDAKNEGKILASKTPLLTAAVQYWTKYCQPGEAHQAAVYYWTQYNLDKCKKRGFTPPIMFDFTNEERRELLHPFAQLSSVIQDAVDLNRLLLNPLPEVDINFDIH